jgi:small subunit ribosomal protein S20
MANTKSAKKAIKTSEARRLRNRSRKTMIKTYFNNCVSALSNATAAGKESVQELFQKAQSAVHRAVTKGVLHKNTAARKISRLVKKINKKFSV